MTGPNKDLVLLVADADMECTCKGLFREPRRLGLRPFQFDIRRHPGRDPGCRQEAAAFLRSQARFYAYALVLFDREGCGQDFSPREKLEADLESQLSAQGWEGRCAVVIPDPELESWVWSDSPNVASCLGWKESRESLAQWLDGKSFRKNALGKPERPKEAMQAVLRHTRKSRSASIYEALAEQVSVTRCTDPAFMKLVEKLRGWFPE